MNTKLKLLALTLTIAFVMASCGSDDSPGIDQNLFGTWTLGSTVLRDCASVGDNSTTNAICDDQTCTRLVLTSDKRYERRETQRGQEEVTERGQIEIGETQINFLPDNTTGSQVFNYEVSGSSFVLSNSTIVCTEDFRYSK